MTDSSYPDTAAGARALMADLLEGDYWEKLVQLEAAGLLTLIPDPEVKNVWGLVLPDTKRAALVLYLADGDCEWDDELVLSLESRLAQS